MMDMPGQFRNPYESVGTFLVKMMYQQANDGMPWHTKKNKLAMFFSNLWSTPKRQKLACS